MTYAEQLASEFKARRARLFPAPKKPDPKPVEEKTVQEIPVTTEADLIARLQAEVAELKAKIQAQPKPFPQPAAPVIVVVVPDEPPAVVRPTVARIKSIVAAYYGVSPLDLESDQRLKRFCHPRHIAVHLCCRLTPRSLPFIGRQFGGRDHTTCLHARDKITKLRESDEGFNAELLAIEQRIMLHAKPDAKEAA